MMESLSDWIKEPSMRRTLVIDVAGQAQYLPPRVTYKSSSVDSHNPGYPKVGFRGWLFAVGASRSVPFDYE